MMLALFLPWVPITLSVAIGARMMRRNRAVLLGVCCALFWIVLSRAGLGPRLWSDAWWILALLIGAGAMIGMALWAGEATDVAPRRAAILAPLTRDGRESPPRGNRSAADLPLASAAWSAADGPNGARAVPQSIATFDDWLERHRHDPDPWPAFDELIRSLLHQYCGASHVRPFRVLSEGDLLVPLREAGMGTGQRESSPADPYQPAVGGAVISARQGIIGHVVTSGQTYIAGDPTLGDLIHALAGDDSPVRWCFAVRNGGRRIGAVAVGQLAPDAGRVAAATGLLDAMEALINLFWTTLAETCRSRVASQNDPVTELLARDAFLTSAATALEESYREHEPVAVAAFAMEGLRRLDDAGLWELSNELVRGMGQLIRRKVRAEDRLGRFDDGRFLLLLRRVDSELARLIVGQLMNKLTAFCRDSLRLGADITMRCGLAGSGTDTPPLAGLIARALTHAHEARARLIPLVSDLTTQDSERAGEPPARLAARPSDATIPAGGAAEQVSGSCV
ncbi:MAG TPA: diguanylate cyclase [Phycisphaerae bacterium]